MEVAGVVEPKRSCERKGIHPGEDGIEEVAGNVEALVAPSQLHHVTVGAAEPAENS